MEWIIANMAPLMFGALVLFLLFGYPVAFALAANGIVSSASWPTTRCSPFLSSLSWD